MKNMSLSHFIDRAMAEGKPLSQIFMEDESRETGQHIASLKERMAYRIHIMREALEKGLNSPQHSRSGYIDGSAYRLLQYSAQGRSLLSPDLTQLLAYAMAIPEVNACMGRIVAAPTAGSCGVLPAVLFSIARKKNMPDTLMIPAFFTAGGIGMVIEKKATISGAQGGCQAEIGSASAMAAGALVEMAGGNPEQSGHAVAFALKNLMGLICDPVGGLVEIPCVKRNALGALNAVAAAEMALAGLTSLFTADQVIETMGKVGRRLPEEFRETAQGGLAALPRPVPPPRETGIPEVPSFLHK